MTDEFKEATAEAFDYADAIQTAIEVVSNRHVAAGKKTKMMDPMSALIGIMGSFIAGAPEAVRPDILAKVDRLVRIAVEQSLARDTAQHVKIEVKKDQLQ